MKSISKYLAFSLLIAAFGCKENGNKEERLIPENSATAQPQTYAEISVKKGGQWEGREYKGGTFENVEELTLPPEHTDHSYYIRYEGPGWENPQVGYRLYLDWRNAIDVFGKKTDTLVLPQVGQDGFDSYHEEAAWGMDILKAGKSLGIGSYGRFMNDTVAHFRNVGNTRAHVSNSDASSEVRIEYSDWVTGADTVDLTSTLSIFPEGRFTKATLDLSEPLEGLTTGIVKFENIDLLQKQSEAGEWAYIATYGNQTLVNDQDKLGMALFYKTADVKEVKEGPHDHLVIFNETAEPITYYFLAAWEQEPGGITTKEAFITELDEHLNRLQESGKLE
ncbi:protein of unknown function [Salinimicrobium sediminis]|uniref:DUF4861 domain-containing protein n=1 Tax=Salinimicrobium sediminis TaxID=1343891 RepID=A0A285X1U0_9FLAO|nr:DUF4861 family protein [Salinimicrobium sediminis]SOC79330.1 protein of unknown function [Salinimicrobium sediminis]